MKWYRRVNLLDYVKSREVSGYVLLICTGLALLQAIFSPTAFSVLILVALLIVVLANNGNSF